MRTNLRLAGGTLIATSLGFIAVFSYLAKHFGYPEVLEGTAERVLPALVAGGPTLRWAWAVYAALPTGVALAAMWMFPALRRTGETLARFGLVAALVASFAMTAGLMRWPTVNYVLGQYFIDAAAPQRLILSAIFDAGNLYLGTVTGELIGELALSLWFLAVGTAIVRGVGIWRWVGYLGCFTAFSMTVGAFRNLTLLVELVAEVNNTLLPIWLIILGSVLIRSPRNEAEVVAVELG